MSQHEPGGGSTTGSDAGGRVNKLFQISKSSLRMYLITSHAKWSATKFIWGISNVSATSKLHLRFITLAVPPNLCSVQSERGEVERLGDVGRV